MKKLLLALPLAAGASWAGSTYYAGTQAQPAYDKLLADLNETAAGLFTLETREYTAGFTHSTAITNVKLEGLPEPVLIQLKHEIQHTPVGSDPQGARFSASSITTTLHQGTIENSAVREFVASFDGGEPFVLYTDVGFTGDVISDLQLNKLTKETDSSTFKFDGGRYQTTSNNNKIDISGVLGQIHFDAGDGNGIIVEESSSRFDLLRVAKGVYTGEQVINFPLISVKNSMSGDDIKVENIILDSVTVLNGENINSTSGLSIANIKSPLPLNSMNWDFVLNGLSVKGLDQYMTTMNKLGDMQEETWQDSAALEAELQKAFTGLLSPGAKLSNKLTLTNDGGDVIGDARVSFQGDGSASGLDTIATLGDLLRTFTVNISLDADAPAIDMTPVAMFMMHPMAQQYILSDGRKYSSDISIANLMLDVNGNLNSLEHIMGDELNQPLDLTSAMNDY